MLAAAILTFSAILSADWSPEARSALCIESLPTHAFVDREVARIVEQMRGEMRQFPDVNTLECFEYVEAESCCCYGCTDDEDEVAPPQIQFELCEADQRGVDHTEVLCSAILAWLTWFMVVGVFGVVVTQ